MHRVEIARFCLFLSACFAAIDCSAKDFACSESFATGGEMRSLHQSWKCGFGWLWRDDALRYDLAGRSFAILRDAPWGKTPEAEAVLIVCEDVGTEWKVAGLTMKADDANYCHVAMIGSPKDKGSKHFIELSEMRKGTWLAQKG